MLHHTKHFFKTHSEKPSSLFPPFCHRCSFTSRSWFRGSWSWFYERCTYGTTGTAGTASAPASSAMWHVWSPDDAKWTDATCNLAGKHKKTKKKKNVAKKLFTLSPIISLSQWLNFKLFGVTYLVGKIKFKLFFSGSIGWVSNHGSVENGGIWKVT